MILNDSTGRFRLDITGSGNYFKNCRDFSKSFFHVCSYTKERDLNAQSPHARLVAPGTMALTLPGRRGGVAMERAKERGRAVLAWSDFF